MDLKIFSGRSNEPLACEIIRYLLATTSTRYVEPGGRKLGQLDSKRGFSDGELYARFDENIRGCDVFIVQSTNQPHENDEELRMMVHTARLASAGRITAVIPYFGYARQDRKDKSRAPISAVRKVKELVACGVDRFLVLDVHSSAVETAAAALNTPCDHLWARLAFLKHIRNDQKFRQFMEEGFVVGAPDLNAGKFARGYAEALGKNIPLVLVEKRRDVSTGGTEVLNVIGNPRGKNVLIVDDLISSGSTLRDAAKAFKGRGAKRIFALSTHAAFSDDEIVKDNLSQPTIEKIFLTNSIRRKQYPSNVEIVSVAELLGEAIYRIHTDQSVSSLFE